MKNKRNKCTNLNLNVMYGNYFKFSELVKTDTNMDNSVDTDSHLANLASLWNVLNYLRHELGRPIIVNSAFRTEKVNKAVGGAKRSLHMQGRAADIRCESPYLEQLWKIVCSYDKSYGLCEKIKYETFIHIAI